MKSLISPLSASLVSLLFILPISCGDSEEERAETATSTTSISSSDDASSESVSTNLTDALETLSDSNISSSSASLALQGGGGANGLTVDRSKSCAVDGDNAVVSIESTISGSVEFTTARASISREVTGSGTTTRTWSQTDASVLCNDDATRAAIDWEAGDISGLSLSAVIERSKSSSGSKTITSSGEEYTKSKSSSASGTRDITWISHTDNDDGTFTRVKSVSSSITRSSDSSNSRTDESISLSLTVATVEDSELQITVVRDSTSKDLVSKLISSGSLKASESEESYVVTSFEDYLLSFSDESCEATSGKVTSQFYEAGSEEPSKTYELTVTDGAYVLMDITDAENSVEVEEFDYDLCDIQNFQ